MFCCNIALVFARRPIRNSSDKKAFFNKRMQHPLCRTIRIFFPEKQEYLLCRFRLPAKIKNTHNLTHPILVLFNPVLVLILVLFNAILVLVSTIFFRRKRQACPEKILVKKLNPSVFRIFPNVF